MKKYLFFLLFTWTSVIATETITITSPDFDKNDPDWVLVEDDCPNPDDSDSPCSQVYVKESEVINYKNKKTLENGLRAAKSVPPTKTDEYLKLDRYFDSDNPPEKIYIWAIFADRAYSESDYEKNKIAGDSIIDSLSIDSYELEYSQRNLELGFFKIHVDRKALLDLYNNNYVLSLSNPDDITFFTPRD